MQKVGIVGYKQSPLATKLKYGRYDLIFETVRGALESADLKKKDITTVISATNDYYDGRTISNAYVVEPAGAYLEDESKVEMDGAFAVLYGLMRILSGNHKLAVVYGGSTPSTYPYHAARLYTSDPTWERPNKMVNDITAGGFQMRAYMEKYGVSAEAIAEVAVKNRHNASKNEHACPDAQNKDITVENVMESNNMSDPVTESMYAHPCDGMAALLLAPEKQALKITDNPVWITGVGYNQDTYYLGDRNLYENKAMKKAADMAFNAANISSEDIDVAEIYEHFAHEELILAEAIGLAEEGKASELNAGIDGDLPINPSGGAISSNAPFATGIIRIIEAVRQLQGKADDHQVKGAQRAIATGQIGFCAQNNIAFILEGGGN
ncbi:MAG: thiolase family protein [Promethearchaeia archaeon]